MGRAAFAVDVEPIDRLEDKVKMLVNVIDTLRAERAKAVDDVARLQHELDAAKGRLNEVEFVLDIPGDRMTVRELIRTRVAQMISQIDKLNL